MLCDRRAYLKFKEQIHTQARAGHSVVYLDGFELRGQRLGFVFSARVRGKVRAKQSRGYQITTSSIRMEVFA